MHNNEWIHIAGNPPNIVERKPPYWRYRIGRSGAEHTFDELHVTGTFDLGNNTQGTELNASFLLWYALYGTPTVEEHSGKTVLTVALADRSEESDFEWGIDAEDQNADIRIYGAPDLVNAGSSSWWRVQLSGNAYPIDIEVTRWWVRGTSSPINNSLGEDVTSDPLHRVWLEFDGRFQLDNRGRALILLN